MMHVEDFEFCFDQVIANGNSEMHGIDGRRIFDHSCNMDFDQINQIWAIALLGCSANKIFLSG